MPPKQKFEVNDKVFVDHGALYYEAKIVEADTSKGFVRYLVHYQGWNQRYDEFIEEKRIIAFNDASIKRAKELEDTNNALPANKKKRRAPNGRDESSRASTPVSLDGGGPRQKGAQGSSSDISIVSVEPKKRREKFRMDSMVETEAQFANRAEIRVKIPEELKPVLVDDWDLIIRQLKLVELPAKRTVRQILDEYLLSKGVVLRPGTSGGVGPHNSHSKTWQIEEVVNGMADYFDVMLGTQLLYKYERLQYTDLVLKEHAGKRMCEVYGAVHLLRLFVRLGHMLAYTHLGEKNVALILAHVHDFLHFMHKHRATLFDLNDYITATADYQRCAFT